MLLAQDNMFGLPANVCMIFSFNEDSAKALLKVCFKYYPAEANSNKVSNFNRRLNRSSHFSLLEKIKLTFKLISARLRYALFLSQLRIMKIDKNWLLIRTCLCHMAAT